uniref:Uncharacterized protein n=1 Tax=Desulfobacca acetoxidans TaxID=60893 RepID=A0A7V4LCI6_9BACT
MLAVNDLVLVYLDHAPTFYARVNEITPDVKRGWYQVELLVLSLPAQMVLWIISEKHLAGEEFTMGGRPVRLELVPPKPAPEPSGEKPPGRGKVISLVRK